MTTTGIYSRFLLQYPAAAKNGFVLDVDIELPGQGISAIFGPSGSGKTSLLRCIAGLQRPQQGILRLGDQVWQDNGVFLPPHKRPIGYVFQEAGLLPHLSAWGNLRYALKRTDSGKAAIGFDQVVSLLDIEPLLERYPNQLSGGERQRVVIARALLINPRLLLMDEPLASLDLARKQEILPYLERLHGELDIPVLYVSHSVDEVARLADYLVVLDQGRQVASGAVTDVMARLDLPVRLGEDTGVVLQAKVMERDTRWHLVRVAFPGAELWVRDTGDSIGQAVRIRILARDVSLALKEHRDTSILNLLAGKVEEITADASEAQCLVRLRVGESALVARITRRSAEQLGLESGQTLWAQIKSAAIVR